MSSIDPNINQRQAANPFHTVYVSANAGSGKTKVLVDRVSKLLLRLSDLSDPKKGTVEPDKILCLTYTKAAATEMQSRLFEKLGKWSVMPPDELNKSLDDLFGKQQSRTRRELSEVRQLFAKALETPGGLKVQTIHAFCEQVLGRFPLEAGILPGFDPMDGADERGLQETVKTDILKQAYVAPDSDLGQAVSTLSSVMANQTFDSLLGWMGQNVYSIKRWEASGGIDRLTSILGLNGSEDLDVIKARAWEDAPHLALKLTVNGLIGSTNAKETHYANLIQQALEERDARKAFEFYRQVVFKADWSVFSQIGTKTAGADTQAVFGAWNKTDSLEMQRLADVGETIKKVQVFQLTKAVYHLAKVYADTFVQAKRGARKLDFNDQINFVKTLLTNSTVADWVRYKLDGGIEHILIDEAQDTSPDQWDIIDALQSEFPVFEKDKPNQQVEKTFFAVGDEKQSIYSFQGAVPEVFLNKTRSGRLIPMNVSFRSAPEVLEFVDKVLIDQRVSQDMFLRDEVAENMILKHSAFRNDHGSVELWPLTPRPEKAEDEVPWEFPIDHVTRSSAKETLARDIALQVRNWLDEKTLIYDRKHKTHRPVQPKDVLILVRRRNDFFDAVIRHLKLNHIDVAGADRLVLKDAMVVKDLLALTRFVLSPYDDLSLAEVLRSPIIDLSEDDLFSLAYDRGTQSLWQTLQDHAEFTNEADILKALMSLSKRHAPYEFYARSLDMMGPSGKTIRHQVFSRFGMEAQDALEAFLARALDHQRRNSPSLHHFLAEFSRDDQDIKREMDSGQNEVRVMTVHGAKGLEAPIVILPDTTGLDNNKGEVLYPFGDGFVYLPKPKLTPDALKPVRDTMKEAKYREYLRLLYVAMTRAESRLVICGYELGNAGKRGYKDKCWYDILTRAMELCPTEIIDDKLVFGQRLDAANDVGRYGKSGARMDLPVWINAPAPLEPEQQKRFTPSQLLSEDADALVPVRSPISQSPDRFLRGNIIHKLLEILPDIPEERRANVASRYVSRYKQLSEDQHHIIIDEVFTVLEHPEFAHLFAPGSQAEINLAGQAKNLPDGLYLNAQIDRLVVTDKHVYIIDYKSNRPPPKDPKHVAKLYLGQMAAYREMIRDIYPDKQIDCALLWTDGPNLMWLDHDLLSSALTEIATLPT